MLTDPIREFLTAAGWSHAASGPLAGDASNRRYLRLTQADGARAVLMDAPPERGEDTRPFVRIAKHLKALGLSAPVIYAQDAERGYLLLEDLGDSLFARLAKADPAQELPLYLAAAEMLNELHRHPAPPGLTEFNSQSMPGLCGLALEWYAHFGQVDQVCAQTRHGVAHQIELALAPFDNAPQVLVQRDFHAENLIWMPDRTGVARVGLLDFQDAVAGHAAYDLVSLLEDARRDVSPETVTAVKQHYVQRSGQDPERFAAAYAAIGAQRNLRILGVFARLSLHFGKPQYVDLIPRVWGHLQTDLTHPKLHGLRDILAETLPVPDHNHLKKLKDLCATVPMP